MADFQAQYQDLFSKGIVDSSYPINNTSVLLPNGLFGVRSILRSFASIFESFGYFIEMIPSFSIDTIFGEDSQDSQTLLSFFSPEEKDSILKITHSGIHKLDSPFFMNIRPDLIIPQVEKLYARSYKNLPVRKSCDGFRYSLSQSVSFSLINDIEKFAYDGVGIFYSEAEYKSEIEIIKKHIIEFSKENLKLSLIIDETDSLIRFISILTSNYAVEVAVIRKFSDSLSQIIKFTVLGSDNKPHHPYITSFRIDTRIYAASIIAHSFDQKIVLPNFLLRNQLVVSGIDISIFKSIRTEVLKSFSIEKWEKLKEEGNICAAFKDGEKIKLILGSNQEDVLLNEIEEKVIQFLLHRDSELLIQEENKFGQLKNEIKSFEFIS